MPELFLINEMTNLNCYLDPFILFIYLYKKLFIDLRTSVECTHLSNIDFCQICFLMPWLQCDTDSFGQHGGLTVHTESIRVIVHN